MAVSKNININIDLSSFQSLFNSIARRVGHLSSTDILFVIAAIFVPPLAVLLKVGLTTHFWINIILTILGFVPGQIHALWVVLFM